MIVFTVVVCVARSGENKSKHLTKKVGSLKIKVKSFRSGLGLQYWGFY